MIDLRSDTVTKPTRQMRHAMASADVGDDVYGEDPTVLALQERVAELFGHEAALYCPSGIMCNQIALQVFADRGTEVVVEADAHVVNYEGGAGALFAGAQFRTVTTTDGLLTPEAVAGALRPNLFPLTPTSLVCIENTHNRRGGTYYELDDLRALRKTVADAGVSLYMDGARVFNASVAAGASLADYGAQVDGLMCCLSKGLGAPVGSVLVGSAEAVIEAAAWRRRFGGGMRQAGVLAAAGLVALERIDRLAEDHAHARLLAEAAAEVCDGVDLKQVRTNIVYVNDVDAPAVCAALKGEGVLAGAMDVRTVRLITHADVSAGECSTAADALRRVLSA